MSTKVKTVFIAHPISGDIRGNMAKVLAICKQVHKKGVVPYAPYLVSLQYLDDGVTEDRELGIDANIECLRRKFIDELWLFGDRISDGMWREVQEAFKNEITIVAKTEGTIRDLCRFRQG